MAYKKLQIRRGLKANIPTLAEGELGFCTDTKDIYIGDGSANTLVGGGSLNTTIGNKVDKVNGKGLSTEDYTTTDKDKLAGIAASATANTVLTLSGALGTSWTGSSAPYTQSVSVSGILASDTPVLDLICSTSNFEAEQEAWGKVFKAVCSANTITFYASEATEVSVSFNARVVR